MRHQVFFFNDWPGGIYGTQAFLGTKPAAPIGAAWAIMHYLGEDGYVRLAKQALDATQRLLDGIASLDGVHVWGEPDMTVLAIGSREQDIFAIGDVLSERGWHFDRQEHPSAIHLMASAGHLRVVDEFIEDLRYAVGHNAGASITAATYGDDVSADVKP
jgi:glutamate/tyrosine decarboxylase-like PLP-dependent enzyme